MNLFHHTIVLHTEASNFLAKKMAPFSFTYEFKPKKKTSSESSNIDYSTQQRNHQYFMEGYI